MILYVILTSLSRMIKTECGTWDIKVICWVFYFVIWVLNIIMDFSNQVTEFIRL
jgi:hypothetical protein